MENCWNVRQFLLKGPNRDLVGFTLSKLQCVDSRLKVIRDIQGGTELSGIRVRAGGTTFSQTEVLAEAIVPSLGPHPTEPQS